MTYLSGQSIGNDVVKLRPNHVMVAYLGADWATFLPNIKEIERLVVQPNPPTNPQALKNIAAIIGWDKIQFLDNLHAKVYYRLNPDRTSGKAIVGSPNLTNNGLGGNGLYEAAVRFDFKVTTTGSPADLLTSFDSVWEMAETQYPDEASKIGRLEKLAEDYKKYLHKGVSHISPSPDAGTTPSICQYGSEWKMDFWPIWYEDYDATFQGDALQQENQGHNEDYIGVSNDDQTIVDNLCNHWILSWKMTSKNRPHQTVHLTWLYIHYAFSNACVNEAPYSAVLMEANDRLRPTPPFELDARTESAIKAVLVRPEYQAFWQEPDDGTGWKTQDINSLMSDWMADVIEERGCP
jgi:phosphatidylserine/phosphatidylglycerophosphate/cardiolipin synthase-like enzyme